MFSLSMRFSCAAAGVVLLAATAVLIGVTGLQRIELLPAIFGVVFLAAAAFGGVARLRDVVRVEDDIRRLRDAALFCFSVAVAMYVFVLVAGPRSDLAQSVTSLAIAFWIVAMLLTFVFAFYASHRRALARGQRL